jgi:D-alanyl-D-alanine carboxypeptidase
MAALSMAAAGGGQVPAAAPAMVAAPPAAPAAPAPAAPAYRTASAQPAPPALASAQSVPAALTPSRPAPVAAALAPEQPAVQVASLSAAPKATVRTGWIIQIGAFPDEAEARERLESAQNIGKGVLGRADPFTERVVKGNETLYRARFAGLDERRAEAACKYFKRNKIDCFTVRN